MSGFFTLRSNRARTILKALDESSATGPDGVSALILKRCCAELAVPFCYLARVIIASGEWPDFCRNHWVFPLYKRKSVFQADNYRGIQLAPQLSKGMERFLGKLFLPYLECANVFGENQYAYRPARGARDAILVLVTTWLLAFARGKKLGLYCSDVSGAFDRVDSIRLCTKLYQYGIHFRIVRMIGSWLAQRTAEVVVGGSRSRKIQMKDMVYQGTVWGPPLWNLYFADARIAIYAKGYVEVIFADDLNCFKEFDNEAPNSAIRNEHKYCQRELHSWGEANRVTFDGSKESCHILSRTEPEGEDFRILGIIFDGKLLMHAAVRETVCEASWRVKTLLRTHRYFTKDELVVLFKSHVLSYIEYRSAGITHAASSVLAPLDNVLVKFLEEIGLSSEAGFITNFCLRCLN